MFLHHVSLLVKEKEGLLFLIFSEQYYYFAGKKKRNLLGVAYLTPRVTPQ